jgi:sugar/nucleoside kinase (ribokinase family)
MIKQWRQEQINVRHIVQDKKQESNYSTVLSFRGERTILVYHYPRTYRLPPQVNAEWMYYTSCGPGHEKMEPDLIHYLDAHAKTRLVFNPGTHQLKRGLKNLAPLLERCTILSLNREEAERLLESTSLPLPKMMRAFHRYGVEICLITDGEKGSYASDGELMWKCPIFPGPCLERTGAGDGYTSAFLAAIFRGQDIPEAMRYGTAEAWSVVQYTGPQKGLLSLPRLHSIIKRFRAVRITSSRL